MPFFVRCTAAEEERTSYNRTSIESRLFSGGKVNHMTVVAVDLGTTNSLCAVFRDGRPQLVPNAFHEYLTPSAVHIRNGMVSVGRIARDRLITDPQNSASLFKRKMGTEYRYMLDGKEYSPEELSSFVIRQLVQDAEDFLHEKVNEVIISVPAYFDARQREATRSIGRLIGIRTDRLINEPSAAALACRSEGKDETFAVLDFGGGTLDVSVVECFDNIISIASIAGRNTLGGTDFDCAAALWFCAQENLVFEKLSKQQQASLMREAERCKILLGQQEEVCMSLTADGKKCSCIITREILRDISMPVLEQMRPVIEDAVQASGLLPSEIDAMILVGGTCRMPLVQEYLSKILNLEIITGSGIDSLVARGLAAVIGIRQREEPVRDLVLTDICPFSLSTAVYNRTDEKESLAKVIIPRNSALPIRRTIELYALKEGQNHITVSIYQGESMYAGENLLLGTIVLPIPVNRKEQEKFLLTYSYDINSMLYAEVKIVSTGEVHYYQIAGSHLLQETDDPSGIRTISGASMKLEKEAEYEALMERMKRIYAEMDPDEKESFQEWVQRFSLSFKAQHGRIRRRTEMIRQAERMLDEYEEDRSRKIRDLFRDAEEESDEGGGMYA